MPPPFQRLNHYTTEKAKRQEEGGKIIYQRKTNNPKMGRPKSTNPKSIEFGVSIDIGTEIALQEYCQKKGISKAEAIRRAIQMLLNAKTE